MNIASHFRKVERFERIRAKLDPVADCELWYWAMLNGSVHAVNAALHALGATVEEECYAHNVPVYVERDSRGRWEPVVRPFGDLEHVDNPELEAMLPPALKKAGLAVRRIERVREPILRGTLKPSKVVLDTVRQAYDEAIAECRRLVAAKRGAVAKAVRPRARKAAPKTARKVARRAVR